MPGWVKAMLVAILLVAVLAIALVLIFGGEHGPGRHGSLGSDGRAVLVSAAGP
jgi:hypothetical protein